MYGLIKPKHGFTMIEVIIVIAILAVFVTMTFSVQLFGMKIFDKGQYQFNSQSNIRLASEYITKELRYAETIEILSSMPATVDPLKKYIYIDGGSIKHYIGGLDKYIIKDSNTAFTPSLVFNKSAVNEKIMNYVISGNYKGQSFSIASEVLPVNMKSADVITGAANGTAVSYGPFTYLEIVEVDKALLSLKACNIDLVEEADGSLNLPITATPFIFLPIIGVNGSTITWTSSNPTLVQLDGNVIRPTVGSGYISVTLTATIKKDIEETTREFTVKVYYSN